MDFAFLKYSYLKQLPFLCCRKDDVNDGDYTKDIPSIQALLDRIGQTIPEMISGDQSLGAMFENENYESFPSPRQPTPGKSDFLFFDVKTWLLFCFVFSNSQFNISQ